MAKWTRLAAVCLATLTLGMALTAAAFSWFDAAHSDLLVVGLAVVLCAGNFAFLKWGIAWAGRPSTAVSVDVNRVPVASISH